MAKWTDYTTDTNPTDTDEVMILDADKSPKANKRVTLSTLADYFLDKLASKVFEKLETQNKTVIGALNELNSNRTVSMKIKESDTAVEIIKNNWDKLPENIPLDLYLSTSTVNCTAHGYRYGKYGMFEILSIDRSMCGWLRRYLDEYTFYANLMIK